MCMLKQKKLLYTHKNIAFANLATYAKVADRISNIMYTHNYEHKKNYILIYHLHYKSLL